MAKKTLDQLLEGLTNVERDIEASMPKIVAEYAESGLALVINKIQHETGVGGEVYSSRPSLVTQSVFLQKDKFKPDVVGETLGRDAEGKLVKGGVRTKKGSIKKSETEKRYRYVKFPKASKAVPVMTLQNGYKELRDIQGLQTAKVDLTYSGRMIQNTKLLSVENRGAGKEVAMIGGTNKEVKDKLKWNYLHYGNFLGITKKIGEAINQIPVNRIKDIFNKHL